MKKNVASQKIGAQMVSATDGSAFTGSVTVSVTGDAGTQATGSVGSGACTHEGNGYHTYAPAQAETNYDLIAFTFTGTGAIPQTLQVYTSFPQTADAVTTFSGRTGTSQSAGSFSDITLDASASAVDSYYRGQWCLITGGAGAGQVRLVSAYTGATKIATVVPSWITAVDATSTFTLIPAGNIYAVGSSSTLGNTGAASSVSGSVTGNVNGNVQGNVSGNVVGSVGSVTAGVSVAVGGIPSTAFVAGAIDAAALNTDAVTEIWSKAIAELAQAAPSATPTVLNAIALLHMIARNTLTVTATTKSFTNDAGTVVFKKTLSDDGTTYTEAEAVSGP